MPLLDLRKFFLFRRRTITGEYINTSNSIGHLCHETPNKIPYDKPVWLNFHFDYGKVLKPYLFRQRSDLAASEVLSALIQFPEWINSWEAESFKVNLAGYEIQSASDRYSQSYTPYVHRVGSAVVLGLRSAMSGGTFAGVASNNRNKSTQSTRYWNWVSPRVTRVVQQRRVATAA